MAVDVAGIISIVVFYVVILGIGFWAARKTGLTKNLDMEDTMLANRSIGYFVGIFTITATWVGGGYINGGAEVVAKPGHGLIWCQAPIGFAISLLIGGIFFCDKMRTSGFTTMLDPFHWKFGSLMNVLLYIPALTGDVFWSASILAALGASLKVILDINFELAIIISAAISLLYTLVGGLYSVAYTDVIQLILIFIGLWLCVPFAMSHEHVDSIAVSATPVNMTSWLGKLPKEETGNWIDLYMLLMFGGIPWQVYWQRALAAKTVRISQILSFVGSFGCIFMVIPAVLLGAVASRTHWNETAYGFDTILEGDASLTLPLVMKHLCPPVVCYIGLGSVSAAVMSSTDSSILSSSSMFARNVYSVIYGLIHKKKPSDTMIIWVMRAAQVVIATMACLMAIKLKSVYGLFVLCGDLVYVLVFPQLVCVMYIMKSNSYGSLSGFLMGFLIRILGGDKDLGIEPTTIYPNYDAVNKIQQFPYRTFSMLISFFTILAVSYLTDWLFTTGRLSLKYDYYKCFTHLDKDKAPAIAMKKNQLAPMETKEATNESSASNVENSKL